MLTGRILARLHPEAQVNIKGFEELPPHRNGYFDVVSSNIPFGDIRVFDPSFDNGTATINTEICEQLGIDFDELSEKFAPYCTKVQSIVTAESFDDVQ